MNSEMADGDARRLAWLLRGLGAFDSCAAVAVVAPRAWLADAHAWLGLGALPDTPVVNYLMRSASALYALFGVIMVLLSFDVRRYWRLIGFLNWAALVHGAVIVWIGIAAGLPAWWPALEGIGYFAPAAAMLALYYRTPPLR
jgi:hypothetical protein